MEKMRTIIEKSKMVDSDSKYKYEIPKCPICGEPIGKVVKTAFGTIVGPRACKCRREKLNKQNIESKNLEKQIRLKQVIKNSLINKSFRKNTFKNWNHFLGNERLYKISKKYAENFYRMKENNQGILVYGNSGNGKTYFSSCIANYLLDKLIPVMCIGSIGLTEKISESKKSFGENGIFKLLNSLDNADLLIIDDLGTEPDNKWTRAMIYQIIEKRNTSKLPLIITTNINLSELKERYDERTYSRLIKMCRFIENTSNDIRKVQGRQQTSLFKEILETK